jgi:FkbM family methyltransferase
MPAPARQSLRERISTRGIAMICGPSATVDAKVALQIPIFSAAIRMAALRLIGLAGIRSFVSRSGLGHAFVCHVGDLAEFPFYVRRAYAREIGLCAAWLAGIDRPVVCDIGANTGFISGHLAQILGPRQPRIFAFEPVPTTFAKLAEAIDRLGLSKLVIPVERAVVDTARPVRISYSDRHSLLAQVTPRGLNPRVGDELAEVEGLSLDEFCRGAGIVPDLVKIDVEGSEAAVFRGARSLLSRRGRPALLFEFNPTTLRECGVALAELPALLAGYSFHYVDDLCGQRLPLGTRIDDLAAVDWICNLFAVPLEPQARARWRNVLASLSRRQCLARPTI